MNTLLIRFRIGQILPILMAALVCNPSYAGLELADLRNMKTVVAATISPDGDKVAYVVREPDMAKDKYVSDLWVVDWSGRNARRLVDDSTVLRPEWSPDGERIAFVSDRSGELAIWSVSLDSSRLVLITDDFESHGRISTHPVYASLQWSPDGNKIAFVAHDLQEPEDPYVWQKWHWEEGFGHIRNRLQIWTVDVGSGRVQQLTSGDFHHGEPVWSPDGSTIAFTANRRGAQEAILWSPNENYDIWTVPSSGGEISRITDNEGPDTRPVWSPDGRYIAYVSVPYRGSHSDVKALRVTKLSTLETAAITDTTTFDYSVNLMPGAWIDSKIFFTAGVGVTTQAFSVSSNGNGSAPQSFLSDEGVVSSLTLSSDGKRMAFLRQAPASPPEVWRSKTSGRQKEAISDVGATLRSEGLSSADVIEWTSYDGMKIEGILIRPENYDPEMRYPLVVAPHGGPHGASTLRFNAQDQVYASEGFLVFQPNFRGSAGYGQRFIDADRANFGGGDFRDVMTGVDYLVSEGIADPDRLVISGWSYGGFMTSWAVGHTDRFKAAVAGAPPTNLQTFFALSDIPRWTTWENYGYPWEMPDLYRANSPITYVQNVTTPTMVMHGAQDIRVPLSQGIQFYTSLKALGVPTRMVIYPGAGHGLSRPGHQVHRIKSTIDWFRKYIDTQ